MEPLTIFAAAVAFIGFFHLLSTTLKMLGINRKKSVASATKTRSDWYCFFKMSDLHGHDEMTSDNRVQHSRDIHGKEILEQRRRQQARRPILHV